MLIFTQLLPGFKLNISWTFDAQLIITSINNLHAIIVVMSLKSLYLSRALAEILQI